jgi:two-component system cell cycle sensor histidine kinase/response regulator CckA
MDIQALARAPILVVEDDLSLRRLAVAILTSAGHPVLEANDGAQAVEIVQRHGGRIALVFTDVVMPHMNGQELAAWLADAHPDLPILFTSAHTGDPALYDFVEASRDRLLVKPYTPAQLLRRVAELLVATRITAD